MLKICDKVVEKTPIWCKARTNKIIDYWSKVFFSDECKVHPKQLRIRFVRRYVSKEYCRKESKYEGQKGVLVWTEMSYDGPALQSNY